MRELYEAIRELRKDRASDQSGITAELIKSSGEPMRMLILELYNAVLQMKGDPPKTWRTLCISVLFKSGDPQEPGNYRPIAIISVLYKLFSRMVLKRIKAQLDKE
eukprot:6811177-Karenia_brevis.AAC.1